MRKLAKPMTRAIVSGWAAVLIVGMILVMDRADVFAQPNSPDLILPQTGNGTVLVIVRDGNTVYVGGSFTIFGGVTRNRLAAFNAITGVVDPNWNPNVGGTVNALAVAGGKVYAGGSFTTVNGGTTRNRLAAFNIADGTNTGTVDAVWNPNLSGDVNVMLIEGGKLYAGGSFTQASGIARNRLAAFTLAEGGNSGLPDTSWNPNANSNVFALASAGGKLYVGGAFSNIGGIVRTQLAAVNMIGGTSPGSVDASWNPAMNNSVSGLAVSAGKVYAGGNFTTVNGGTVRNHIAAFNLANGSDNGTADAAWNPNLDSNASEIKVIGKTVYLSGSFTTVNGGTIRNRAAAFNAANGSDTGTVLSSWNPNCSASVSAMEIAGAGLYLGGLFATVNGIARNGLAGFGTAGADLELSQTSSPTPPVPGQPLSFTVTLTNKGPLNGENITVNNPITGLASAIASTTLGSYSNPNWTVPEITWPPMTPDSAFPQVNSGEEIVTIIREGNKIYVGGLFTSLGGVARNNLAAFNALTGAVDSAWNPNVNGVVSALAVSGDKIYACGDFTTVNGGATNRNRLAAFGLAEGGNTGTVDPSWNPNLNLYAKAVITSGRKVYVGGNFTTVNGGSTTRNRLAAFNLAEGGDTGIADSAWNPNMNAVVEELLVVGTRLHAVGYFTTAGGSARNRAAAFTLANGSSSAMLDASWNPNLNDVCRTITYTGGKVYLGGYFTTVTGGVTARNRLAAFNPANGADTGLPDSFWNPNLNSYVTALTVYGNKLYAGGNFTTVNGGTVRTHLAAIGLANGSSTGLADSWNPSVDINSFFYALCSSPQGVVAGGSFLTIGGVARIGLAGFGHIGTAQGTLTLSGLVVSPNPITNTAEITAAATSDPDSTPGNGASEDDRSLKTVTPSDSLINWENPPVNPIGMSLDGQTLAVCNLPDNRVELYSLSSGLPIASGSVCVGLDPTSLRFRNHNELWVISQISDSISVVDLATKRVKATITTLDEPQDVVFAGNPQRAYVSCSQVNTVQVFNPVTLAQTATVAIDGEDPRALAVSPDGTKVYAAIFESGNKSTLIGGGADEPPTSTNFPPNAVNHASGPYGGTNPPPNSGTNFVPALGGAGTPPKVAMIVKQNAAGQWMDDNNHDWSLLVSGASAGLSGRPVGWQVRDNDLAVIDAASLGVTYATGIMNICMAAGVNPVNGMVYVVGTDATNEVRFEPNVKGKFTRVNLGVVSPSGPSTLGVVDLNSHLDYLSSTITQTERDKSLGDPRGIAWDQSGTRGFITGMGSNNLIVIDDAGSRLTTQPVELGEGPMGLAVDSTRNQLYVLNRFGGSLSVVNSVTFQERAKVAFFDPTPAKIKTGRKHLYDTHKNSGLGQIACASCHLDSKMDRLAWDLGDPSGALDPTNGLNNVFKFLEPFNSDVILDANFHPMKGPMTTQTLQDIIGQEPLHWRGDRDGIEQFNGAFIGLQGDDTSLTTTPNGGEMQEFENFLASIHFPPNPFRNFDNTLSTSVPLTGHFASGKFAGAGGLAEGAPFAAPGDAVAGLLAYRTSELVFVGAKLDCVSCHTLPVGAGANKSVTGGGLFGGPLNFNTIANGPLGEKHLFATANDGSTQDAIKVPQLRNLYDKVGMDMKPKLVSRAGFGFTHDGAVDSLSRFLSEPAFVFTSDQQMANVIAFLLSFAGSDLPLGLTSGNQSSLLSNPIDINMEPQGEPGRDTHAGVGREITVTNSTVPALVNSMIAEAVESGTGQTRGIDLVVKGMLSGTQRGWFYRKDTALFIPDKNSESPLSLTSLMALASPTSELTFMAVPRGSGYRVGIDRDEDGFGDKTELEGCSDPENAASTPASLPDISVNLGAVAFGSQDVNAGATAAQVKNISNVGLGTLNFKGAKVAITGTDAADFAVASALPSTVLSGQNVNVSFVFNPVTAGAKSANLTIITDSCNETLLNIPLTGTGTGTPNPPPPTPPPSPNQFDLSITATVTSVTPTQINYTCTVTNIGAQPIDRSLVTVQGFLSNDEVFGNGGDGSACSAVLGSAGQFIAPGGTVSLPIACTTTTTGFSLLIVKVDSTDAITEVNEVNNFSITPKP